MTGPEPSDLQRRLREADEEELRRLLADAGDAIGVAEARQVVRNPFVTGEILAGLAEIKALRSRYEVRRDLAAHPKTPRLLALQLVGGLYWRELAALGIDARVHPVVRRAADRRLVERLPGLAVGEKSALARQASSVVLTAIRFDPNPRVISALLENPRLTEGLLLPLVAHERAASACLAVVAGSARWSVRPAVRSALCRNAATPLACSLRLVSGLARDQLAAVASDLKLPAPLRARARERLGAGGSGRGPRS